MGSRGTTPVKVWDAPRRKSAKPVALQICTLARHALPWHVCPPVEAGLCAESKSITRVPNEVAHPRRRKYFPTNWLFGRCSSEKENFITLASRRPGARDAQEWSGTTCQLWAWLSRLELRRYLRTPLMNASGPHARRRSKSRLVAPWSIITRVTMGAGETPGC